MPPEDYKKPLCKYGLDCYQRNSEHHTKYEHPKRKNEKCESDKLKRTKLRNIESNNVLGEASTSDSALNKEYVHLPVDVPSRIETVFLVKMPNDFYSFYDFCKNLDKNNPCRALAAVDIKLVGPFDLFDKELKQFSKEDGLRHYRYYYDPPEFLTVLTCNNDQELHYGYFRDDPKEMPEFVASNEASKGCTINIVGGNLFSAFNYHIEQVIKLSDPFKKIKIQKIQRALTEWCSKNKFEIDTRSKCLQKRKSKMIARTFHGVGIVVPFNKKNELGYRKLQENDKELKKILQSLCGCKSDEERTRYWAKLHPIITGAAIANDEFDFGTSLELGIDLFSFGEPLLHKVVLSVLPTSYELLGRAEYAVVVRAHLANRVKGNLLNTIVK